VIHESVANGMTGFAVPPRMSVLSFLAGIYHCPPIQSLRDISGTCDKSH